LDWKRALENRYPVAWSFDGLVAFETVAVSPYPEAVFNRKTQLGQRAWVDPESQSLHFRTGGCRCARVHPAQMKPTHQCCDYGTLHRWQVMDDRCENDRPEDAERSCQEPVSRRDALPQGHPVFFLLDLAASHCAIADEFPCGCGPSGAVLAMVQSIGNRLAPEGNPLGPGWRAEGLHGLPSRCGAIARRLH
jgi:hypothetical protein